MARTNPKSIIQRVRAVLPTFDGEFTAEDVRLKAGISDFKKNTVSTAMSMLMREGTVRLVRRDSGHTRRSYYEYVKPDDDTVSTERLP